MGLKPGSAAERLGLSVRQVERLVIRYRDQGPSGVVSGRRGRPLVRRWPARSCTCWRTRRDGYVQHIATLISVFAPQMIPAERWRQQNP
ncbi:hypothetical protein [Paraburkholderia phenoliruptrix]